MSYSYLNGLSSYETNHNNISSYANKIQPKEAEKSTLAVENKKPEASSDNSKTEDKTSKVVTSKSTETLESLMEKLNNTSNIAANVFSSLNNSYGSSNKSSNDVFGNFSSIANSFNSMKSVAFMRTVKNYYKNLETSNTSSNGQGTAETSKKLQSAKLIDLKDSLKQVQRSENSIKLNLNSAKTSKNLNIIEKGNDNDKSYMNDLVNSISDFANNYNNIIDKSSNIESSSILSNVLSMTKMTRYNATSLNEIGISLGSDNKLTVNKEQLKNADLDKINSLFGENGSYGDYTADRASALNSLCMSQIKKEVTSEKFNTISSYLNVSYSGNYLDKAK